MDIKKAFNAIHNINRKFKKFTNKIYTMNNLIHVNDFTFGKVSGTINKDHATTDLLELINTESRFLKLHVSGVFRNVISSALF